MNADNKHFGPDMWDERFQPDAAPYGTHPSLYLVEHASLLRPGARALVPADGGGRNGVWLAEQGLDVLSVDFSPFALQRTRELAAERGVRVRTELADLIQWTWPVSAFDVVVSVYFHQPAPVRTWLHRSMLEALKPGGHVILEAFHVEQLAYNSGGPKSEEQLFTEERLRSDFAGADVLECRKERIELHEGRLHRGPAMLMRMVARRPLPH